MTKTKRSNEASFVTVSISHSLCVPGCHALQKSRSRPFRADAGETILIAFSISVRLNQDRTHSLNTACPLKASSTVDTKHWPDSWGFAVSKKASRYRCFVWFKNMSKKQTFRQ